MRPGAIAFLTKCKALRILGVCKGNRSLQARASSWNPHQNVERGGSEEKRNRLWNDLRASFWCHLTTETISIILLSVRSPHALGKEFSILLRSG